MQLNQLIADLPFTLLQGGGEIELTNLTDDSRLVTPGCLFIARTPPAPGTPGTPTSADHRSFIEDAIARGAVAILAEPALIKQALPHQTAAAPLTIIAADTVDQALCGRLAERFFDHPSRKLKVIGITGTNGKTTTAFLIQHLLAQAGCKCGLVGTVINDDGRTRHAADLTTPGAIEFSRLLAAMVSNRCEAVVAEFSSHALHQGRVAALKVDVAVFTNLTGDHLDYHRTMEDYAAAKAILFRSLPSPGFAVINHDDPFADAMVRDCVANVLRCGVKEGVDPDRVRCRAQVVTLAADHSRVVLDGPWGSFDLRLPLVGRHNVYNALQAVAAANCVKTIARVLRDAMTDCPAPPGRLEPVRVERFQSEIPNPKSQISNLKFEISNPQSEISNFKSQISNPQSEIRNPKSHIPSVLVDYAHTHDALENVLSALKPLTRGRLIVVFGCGGDRDKTKRPKMADIACRWTDRVIITSDNPRTEDPRQIIDEVVGGRSSGSGSGSDSSGGAEVIVEIDRARAIAMAIAGADAEDVVLIAGKGHEDYQIIGKVKHHFDDREHAAAALMRWRERPLVAAI